MPTKFVDKFAKNKRQINRSTSTNLVFWDTLIGIQGILSLRRVLLSLILLRNFFTERIRTKISLNASYKISSTGFRQNIGTPTGGLGNFFSLFPYYEIIASLEARRTASR